MSATIINFNEFRKQRDVPNLAMPGTLVWLHCPTCELTQYTLLRMEGGRIHKCGTLVDEVEIPMDIRAEYTISQRNLEILQRWRAEHLEPFADNEKLRHYLETLLARMEASEEEFQKKVASSLTQPIAPYDENWTPQEADILFDVIDPFGTLVTYARQPERHFSS